MDDDLWGSTPKINYALKSLVYKEVFKKLDLNNWLHGDGGQFERFAVSGVSLENRNSVIPGFQRTDWDTVGAIVR